MDRRKFVKTALAGTTMGAANWTAHAADRARLTAVGDAAIVIQRDAPHALELADRLRFGLARTGIGSVTRSVRALHDYADISELLSHHPGTSLIGITQDATAILTQAIAATQGSTCVLQVQHRIEPHIVRHRCTTPVAAEALSWSERRAVQDAHLGALYAGMFGARPLPQDKPRAALDDRTSTTGISVSLVSFLIRI